MRAPGHRGARGHVLARAGLALVPALAALAHPVRGADPPPVVTYEITAALDAQRWLVGGRARIRWRNTATLPAPDLQFHLFLNAFANNRSTFLRGPVPGARRWAARRPPPWGYIAIDRLVVDGRDLTARCEHLHPDDGNIEDRTVLRVPLDEPVAPGATASVEIDFRSQLPRLLARAGHVAPFAMVAQWFPKLGVFGADGWQVHQYHALGEFFADFGRYDVTLTVPADVVVGATGTLADERRGTDGTKTLRFVAEPVHDFAWAADPRFRVVTETVEDIGVRLLLQPPHRAQGERYLRAARAAIRRYRERIGAWPFRQLTIVDPGPGARAAGGMEYPTLFTAGTTWGLPAGIRLPEYLVVHEFGHQYWYGVVANDEAREPWLDEGLTTFFEGRIMDATYGPGSYVDFAGIRLDSLGFLRLRYLLSPSSDPVTQPAWRFRDRRSYDATVYAKTALLLDTLGRRFGMERLEAALADFYRTWAFRHPGGADLRAALRTALGADVDSYLDQFLDGTDVLDYAVTDVDARPLPPFQGYPFTDGQPGPLTAPPKDATAPRYRNSVTVERLGGVVLPVVVQVTFDDGTTSRAVWSGRERWQRFRFTGPAPVLWAEVDPDRQLTLDVNWLNNSRMRTPGTRGPTRLVAVVATVFQYFIQLVGWL